METEKQTTAVDSPTLIVPLKADIHGGLRVSGTRVTLDVLIACHQRGETPEEIHSGFPTVPLGDIYVVIAYYLANKAEMDTYLKQRDEEAEQLRLKIEAQRTPEQRERDVKLRARIEQKRRERAE